MLCYYAIIYVECHNAECRYAECRGAPDTILAYLRTLSRTEKVPLKHIFMKLFNAIIYNLIS